MNLPPVPLALCIKAFQAKKGGRGDFFEIIKYSRFIKSSHLPHRQLAPSTINDNYQSEASGLTVRLDGLNTKYAENLQNRYKISIFADRKRNKR